MLEVEAVRDRRQDLIGDLERSKAGDNFRSLDGDRRLPLWYASGMSEAPPDIAERLWHFINRLEGKNPDDFELRHNWWQRTIDFVRWIPEFEDQDGTTALVVRTPQELHNWPDAIGWLPGGDFMLDRLWSGFLGNADEEHAAAKLIELAARVKELERQLSIAARVINRAGGITP